MLFNNKYKELYERQIMLTEESISECNKWRDLAIEISEKYDKLVKKDLPEAMILIKKLSEANHIILEKNFELIKELRTLENLRNEDLI